MLTITLPWPSADLSPNGGVARWPAILATKKAREYAWGLALSLMKPSGIQRGTWRGPVRVQYTFHAKHDRDRDDDNFIRRMKPARDGIAKALGMDDASFALEPVIWGNRGDNTVDVTLTPATVILPVRGGIA